MLLACRGVLSRHEEEDEEPAEVSFIQDVAIGTAAANTTTPTLTVGGGVTTTSGNILILRFCCANRDVASIADSKGNTWQIDYTYHHNVYIMFASCKPSTQLTTGDTITVTLSGAVTLNHGGCIEEWSGMDQTTWFRGHDSGWYQAGTGTTRQTTGVMAGAGDLVLGLWVAYVGSETVTPDTGYANSHTVSTGVNSLSYCIEQIQQVVPSGGSYAPYATSTNNVHSEGFAAYYGAA